MREAALTVKRNAKLELGVTFGETLPGHIIESQNKHDINESQYSADKFYRNLKPFHTYLWIA